jgi:acyl-coenzyme A synthetase/AMP-(fatty) acid ligase
LNLVRAIADAAQSRADTPALITSGGRGLSFGGLETSLGRLAAFFSARGIVAGDPVGVAMPTLPLHLLTILALARLGAVSLSTPPGQSAAVTAVLARRYGLKWMVSDKAGRISTSLPLLLVERGWQGAARAIAAAQVAPGTAWRIALSSGTTGSMKATVYTHGETLDYARLSAGATPGGTGPGTRLLCFMGLGAGFTLRSCLRHLLGGGAVVFARSSTRRAMADALRRHRVTHAVASPALLRSLCDSVGEGGPHFPDLRYLAVGGSALSPALVAEAQARITPHLYSHYGASEAGLVARAGPEMLRRRPDCAGKLMPWIEAEAVDAGGRPRAPGAQGELRFRGPGVATAFLRDPRASARSFRDGWFYPGDLGRIDEGRRLFVDGRVDDRINMEGSKLDPRAIELALERHPQVIEAAALAARAGPQRATLCAAVVLRGRVQAGALLEHCRRILGSRRAPARYFAVRKLPRNANGKLMRAELKRAIERRLVGRANARS